MSELAHRDELEVMFSDPATSSVVARVFASASSGFQRFEGRVEVHADGKVALAEEDFTRTCTSPLAATGMQVVGVATTFGSVRFT